MKLAEDQIKNIRGKFLELSYVDDLVALFSYIQEVQGLKPIKANTQKTILDWAFNKEKTRYKEFIILKKNGGERKISSPEVALKWFQRKLNVCLNIVFEPHYAAYGFVPQKSIVQNAKQHINKNFVLNVDIEDFFGSIHFRRVARVLQISPFNLNNHLAFLIANLCCEKNSLPQGAPTSPVLSNIVCQSLDRKLTKFAKQNFAKYTRYADDITFSSKKDVFNDVFMQKLAAIIESEKFKLNEKKTRIQSYAQKQTVTGLTVNQKVNVSQKYVRELRALLHNWKTKGKKSAILKLVSTYSNVKAPKLEAYVSGKLLFLKMVKGEHDLVYLKYLKQYEELAKQTNLEIGAQDTTLSKSVKSSTKKLSDYIPISNHDVRKSCEHNPLRTLDFLQVFTSNHKYSLRKLVHPDDEHIDLFEEFNHIKNEYKPDGDLFPEKKHQITKWLYNHIKKDLIELYENKGLSLFNKSKRHPFKDDVEFTKKIYEFKKTYRLGTNSNEETLMTKLIENAIKRASYGGNGFSSKFNAYNFVPKANFNDLASFMVDVTRLEQAILLILNICIKHSNGNGVLKFSTEEKQNKLIFNITDIGSLCHKNVENIKGGDFESIIQKLWSLCDFNIIAMFKEENNYIRTILPENNVIKPYNEPLHGFTYQLIFYKELPKVLLIDDAKERKYESSDSLYRWTDIEDMSVLKRYNAILVHRNFSKANEVISEVKKHNIPLVIFSGGSQDAKEGGQLFLSAQTMYTNLPYFLDNIKTNFTIELDILRYGKNCENNITYNNLLKKKIFLNATIKEQKKDYNTQETKNAVADLFNISSEKIPDFKTFAEFNAYLDKELNKFKP